MQKWAHEWPLYDFYYFPDASKNQKYSTGNLKIYRKSLARTLLFKYDFQFNHIEIADNKFINPALSQRDYDNLPSLPVRKSISFADFFEKYIIYSDLFCPHHCSISLFFNMILSFQHQIILLTELIQLNDCRIHLLWRISILFVYHLSRIDQNQENKISENGSFSQKYISVRYVWTQKRENPNF